MNSESDRRSGESARAGIQESPGELDYRFRGNDEKETPMAPFGVLAVLLDCAIASPATLGPFRHRGGSPRTMAIPGEKAIQMVRAAHTR
ncbi:MAG: hypothetical protein ACREQK_01375, partial [Candidatus Binatia bacterium]